MTPNSDEEPQLGYLHRDIVLKKKIGLNKVDESAPVSTRLFLDSSSKPISCVFYLSSWCIFSTPNPLGNNINVVYNPQATVSIARNLFRFGREHFWLEGNKIKREPRY